MAKNQNDEVSESQIAVHWKEEEVFKPAESFIKQANVKDEQIFKRFSMENFPDCFKEYADMLDWYKPYNKVLDSNQESFPY